MKLVKEHKEVMDELASSYKEHTLKSGTSASIAKTHPSTNL